MDLQEEPLRQALTGNLNGYYGEVWDRYADPITKVIFAKLENAPSRAQTVVELTQKTFTKVYIWLKRHPQDIMKTCLFAILHETACNCVYDYWRKYQVERSRTAVISEEDEGCQRYEPVDTTTPSPEELLEASEEQAERLARLQPLLAILSPSDRYLVTLHYGEKCSYECISTLVCLPAEIIKARVQNAMKRLQRRAAKSVVIS